MVRNCKRLLAVAVALLAAACGSKADPTPAPGSTRAISVRPLPTARHGHRAERVGNELVVFGGYDAASDAEDRAARETWILDLEAGTWRRAADMARAYGFFGSAAVAGSVYAVGGSIERFDPRENRWEMVAPDGSVPRSHLAAAAVGPLIHVFGGLPPLHGGAFAFDTRTHAIVDVPEPPGYQPGDHLHVAAEIGGELHVVGGLDDKPAFAVSRQHWIFDGRSWRNGPPPPHATWAKFAAFGVVGSELFIFDENGGLAFDARTSAWRTRTGPPIPPGPESFTFVMPATAVLEGRLLVLGGEFPARVPSARLYDVASDAWSRIDAPVTLR